MLADVINGVSYHIRLTSLCCNVVELTSMDWELRVFVYNAHSFLSKMLKMAFWPYDLRTPV